MKGRKRCERYMPRRILRGLIMTALLAFCLIVRSAAAARAEGEIILLPGDRYPIPCLWQVRSGREVEVFVENPDIVGLDETGRCIVAVAVGTTEVTVTLTDPFEAYTYVFAVAEYYGTDQMQGNMSEGYRSENLYSADTAGTESAYAGAVSDTDDIGSERPHSGEPEDTGEPENGSGNAGESGVIGAAESTNAYADESHDISAAESESDSGYAEEPEETPAAESDSIPGKLTDKSQTAFTSETEDGNSDGLKDESVSKIGTAPITFTHGRGKYDILVPDHYTLWICAKSAGPISVLYVGDGGIPVPYRAEGNMIYIDSEDLPSGRSRIQVIAADREGRIGAMEGYEIVRSESY